MSFQTKYYTICIPLLYKLYFQISNSAFTSFVRNAAMILLFIDMCKFSREIILSFGHFLLFLNLSDFWQTPLQPCVEHNAVQRYRFPVLYEFFPDIIMFLLDSFFPLLFICITFYTKFVGIFIISTYHIFEYFFILRDVKHFSILCPGYNFFCQLSCFSRLI